MTRDELIALARQIAKKHALDDALICSICEQESSWNQWAIRFEPTFFSTYVAGLYAANKITATEAYARGFSWGLMQCMGQVAREHGFDAPLASLCDPAVGIEQGCVIFATKLKRANGDTRNALLFWNGGGNASYPDQVLARTTNYPPANNSIQVQQAATSEC